MVRPKKESVKVTIYMEVEVHKRVQEVYIDKVRNSKATMSLVINELLKEAIIGRLAKSEFKVK